MFHSLHWILNEPTTYSHKEREKFDIIHLGEQKYYSDTRHQKIIIDENV